jgi:16S rRNA (guanine527-N7)-methyltransferase
MLPPEASAQLAAVTTRFGLGLEVSSTLERLTELLAGDPNAPTTVSEPGDVVRDHIADSLEALTLEAVTGARTAVDLGSGAGFPALPLAIACPALSVTAVESVHRKADFIARISRACEVENLAVVAGRAEELEQREEFDLATARALAPLEVVAEYAAPLLRLGGSLVAWRGRRDMEAEARAGLAAAELGLRLGAVVAATPYPGVEARHLHILEKVAATPPRFPRRPGMARKRPLGRRSDRLQR